jgi:hypothetical protein
LSQCHPRFLDERTNFRIKERLRIASARFGPSVVNCRVEPDRMHDELAEQAFPNSKGSVSVSARNDGGHAATATMTVRDSGTGFTPKIESKRHGLGLVPRLIEQLRGTVLLDSAQGIVWTIQFPTVQAHTK